MNPKWMVVLVGIICLGLGACTVGRASEGGTEQVGALASTATQALSGIPVESTPLPVGTPAPSPALAASLAPSLTTPPVLTLTPTPLPCWRQGGRFEKRSLSNSLLPLPMEYEVYLPPCYDQQPDRRYPVLYLIHGQNYNNDQWNRLGVDEKADALIAAGEIAPFIIVLPRDRSWAQPAEDKFGEVLVNGLVQEVDASYRTLPERGYRAIGGLSRGAGWAVHLGLSHWELFGSIGADSLAVFWTDTSQIRGWLDAIPSDEMPRIYLDIGQNDRSPIMDSTRWFEKLLTDRGIPHEWHLFPGRHEEAYWASHVEAYLRWYAAGW